VRFGGFAYLNDFGGGIILRIIVQEHQYVIFHLRKIVFIADRTGQLFIIAGNRPVVIPEKQIVNPFLNNRSI
jgi:hypothetical protein